jgi:hypothetical protein
MNPWRKRRRRRLYRTRCTLHRMFQKAIHDTIRKSGSLFYDENGMEKVREAMVSALTSILPPKYARAAVYGPEHDSNEFIDVMPAEVDTEKRVVTVNIPRSWIE